MLNVTNLTFQLITTAEVGAFRSCYATVIDLPCVTFIKEYAFYGAKYMTTLVLRSETMCTLKDITAFSDTPQVNGTGYIYVPRALVDSYKAETNWSTMLNQFRALEDYTVDGTIHGDLDWNKIGA